jgi:hypothetical protein
MGHPLILYALLAADSDFTVDLFVPDRAPEQAP